MQEGVVKPGDYIDTMGGVFKFTGRKAITDMGRDLGTLTFTDVIVKSSNVGAIKVGLRVGAERMSLYVRRFGFGRPSSPDFPGENPGIVWDASKLDDSGLGSVSMGYQVGVTPLQMAAAASVIANGGTLYEPHVVRAVVKGGHRTIVPAARRPALRSRRTRQAEPAARSGRPPPGAPAARRKASALSVRSQVKKPSAARRPKWP